MSSLTYILLPVTYKPRRTELRKKDVIKQCTDGQYRNIIIKFYKTIDKVMSAKLFFLSELSGNSLIPLDLEIRLSNKVSYSDREASEGSCTNDGNYWLNDLVKDITQILN